MCAMATSGWPKTNEDVRAKLLRKMRLLKRDLYQLLENVRSP